MDDAFINPLLILLYFSIAMGAALNGNLRPVLRRNAFDNKLVVSYFSSTAAAAAPEITEEVLVSSNQDAYFTGVVLDEFTDTLYYTTQSAIFAYHLRSKGAAACTCSSLYFHTVCCMYFHTA